MRKQKLGAIGALAVVVGLGLVRPAAAGIITDPNDPRTWQSASLQTFANLYFGGDKSAMVAAQFLDDSNFNATGYTAGTLVFSTNTGAGGRSFGYGPGDYSYGGGGSLATNGNAIDEYWIQTSGTVGHTVWDLGYSANKAAVFNTIDHGPLPHEAIESTVYLSNGAVGLQNPLDPTTWTWTQAVVERVWLEGFYADTNIEWDGFAFAVGTGTSATFRYASIIHGGPGALQSDGDDEINGIMGLQPNFTPVVPLPSSAWMGLSLLGVLGAIRRSRRNRAM